MKLFKDLEIGDIFVWNKGPIDGWHEKINDLQANELDNTCDQNVIKTIDADPDAECILSWEP